MRWLVTAEMTISVHTDVEAPNARAALRIARDRGFQTFCHGCSTGETDDEEWCTSGELDGTPEKLHAEPLEDTP